MAGIRPGEGGESKSHRPEVGRRMEEGKTEGGGRGRKICGEKVTQAGLSFDRARYNGYE